jgi:hypothetical protein
MMAEIHYKQPRSGVVGNQLDELSFSLHSALTLHTLLLKITLQIHVKIYQTSVCGHE